MELYYKLKRFKSELFWQYRNIRCYLKTGVWLVNLCNIDKAIAKYALKHLKYFNNSGYPAFMTQEKWDIIIDDMIFFLTKKTEWDDDFINGHHSKYENWMSCTKQEWKNERKEFLRYIRGRTAFSKYWEHLWN